MNRRTLPLGVDIGSTRIRVMEARENAQGAHIRAVASREVPVGSSTPGVVADPEYVGALIEDAIVELGTAERRCVCAIGEPEALLRPLKFPRMTAIERERAARFEAQRFIEFPVEEAVVRVHPVDLSSGVWALGIARSSAVISRTAAIRAAGLRPVAIDHESYAFARALPGFDAVVDVAYQRTNLHVLTGQTPITLHVFNGGADVTRGIERELSLDTATAEKRKRILGTAGAGERARASLTADIASLIQRARGTHAIARVALVGNAARLPGLGVDIEAATGAMCELPVSGILRSGEYPEDVIRSSSPDWTLAAGLALWSVN
jgi:type IV pilus assembly protein PilM